MRLRKILLASLLIGGALMTNASVKSPKVLKAKKGECTSCATETKTVGTRTVTNTNCVTASTCSNAEANAINGLGK